MKPHVSTVLKTLLCVIGAWVLAPLSCDAQGTLTARSFIDLSDLSGALTDNSAVATVGGLASVPARLQCLKGVNPSGNSASITLNVQKASYGIYNPDTDSFDTVSMRSYNGCPTGPTISIKP